MYVKEERNVSDQRGEWVEESIPKVSKIFREKLQRLKLKFSSFIAIVPVKDETKFKKMTSY